jgi:uncharacterized protein
MDNPEDTKFGLKTKTIAKIQAIFKKYSEVKQVIIYGSRAKGSYRPGSDIDLTLKGEAISLQTLLKIENELDDLLLPYKFDLSIYADISDPDVLEHIDRVGRIFS